MEKSQKLLLGLLFLLCLLSLGQAEYLKYKDPKQTLNARISDLMTRMTLAEKIGQMTQIERINATAQVMKDYYIGSVLSGGGSVPRPQATAKDWVSMVNEFQKGSLSTRLGIPMIYGIDAVHGNNNVYKSTIFPHNVGLGATRDPELVKKIGAASLQRLLNAGQQAFHMLLLLVSRDPRWGRCYESYSEDHKIVQEMTEIISGLQGDIPANSRKGIPYVAGKDKVAACAKHYVGDGGTHDGINENNTIINQHGLFGIHMPAYYNSIIKGVSTIMVSYSSWNGEKMHANRALITGFLKNTLHFRGFVISDWQGIDRITSPPDANYTYSSVQAGVNAGIDMVMVPYNYSEFIDDLTTLVEKKIVPMSRINDAVRRILRVKFVMGLFENPMADLSFADQLGKKVMVPYNYSEFIDDLTTLVEKKIVPMSRINDAVRRILRVKFVMGLFENPMADLSFADQLGKKEHRELAREAVRKSLVLLKNGKSSIHPLLPLPKKAKKILVTGSHANNLGYQCGGWTIQWQGESGNITAGTTILDAFKSTVDQKTKVVYSKTPDASFVKNNDFSYAIIVVGEVPYAETAGDNLNLTLPAPGPSTIKTVCNAIKCVVIVVSGRPLVIEPYVSSMDALVAAWLPGSEGQGVADVLFGDYGFTGKLSRTWFKSVDQLPMNVGDKHYDPLFPFGFGLTTEPTGGGR